MLPKTVTSEQLDRLFAALGYELAPADGPQRVYVNREYDAIQVLPPTSQEAHARLIHLMTLRTISIGKGIVDEEGFDRLLCEVTRPAEMADHAA